MTQITKEAIEAAADAYWGRDVQHGATALDQMRLALEAALPFLSTLHIAVEGKVKSLDWEDHSDAVSTMQCTVGQVGEPYHVFCENLMFFAYSGNREVARALSMDSAKAAAQTDYETRILSALISPPGKEGWQLVPVKMTADMINAWSGGVTVTSDAVAYQTSFQDAWKRVLIAAPSSPGKDGGTENTPRTDRETMEKGCPNDPNNDPENQNIGKDGGQEVEAENRALRKIISDAASALPNGAFIHPEASVGFMEGLPKEIALVCSRTQPASTALVERLNLYEEILRVVCHHLELPQSESGPADDLTLYDRALETADEYTKKADADLALNRDKRFAAEALAVRLANSLAVFTKHYDRWMERWDDDAQSSTFSRHTFGELRKARKLIEEADALSASTSREGER